MRGKYKAPLRITILTTVLAVVIGCSAVLVGANYFEDRRIIIDSADKWMSSISGETAQRLERFFDEARLIADITAGLPAEAISLDKPEPVLRFLTGALQRHETAYSAYIADNTGAFIQVINVGGQSLEGRSTLGFPEDVRYAQRIISRGALGAYQHWTFVFDDGSVKKGRIETNISYDPRVRPWYGTALAANFTVNTEPYVFQSLQRPGITFSRKLSFLDGAVFGLDISVAQLSEFLHTQRFGDTTRLAITDNSGVLIAQDNVHDYLDVLDASFRKQRMPKIVDVKDPVLKTGLSLERTRDGDSTIVFESGEGDQILSWREVSGPAATNWVISVVAPVDQFTGPMVESMYRSMLFAAALILFVAVPGVTILAGWITRPMIRVSEDADKIRKFDFSGYKPRPTVFKEIAQLSQSMADMRQTIDAFSRYVPKDVVMKLMQSGKIARIGGSRQRVTLMFTDIAGFTDLSEGADPEFLLEHTSVYFEALTKAISKHNGVIDKFIGDAIMAVWNAPLEDPAHIINACRGILATHQASEELNRLYEEKGRPILVTRLGLHSGDAVVGNMGATNRMGYTALGDTVNLAARLEGLNKHYGTRILVSGDIVDGAGDRFIFRIVDRVTPKGTTQPVTIYELVGAYGMDDGPAVAPEMQDFIERFSGAFDIYQQGMFGDACKLFEALGKERPDDGPTKVMIDRCCKYADNPPEGTWTGVERFDKK